MQAWLPSQSFNACPMITPADSEHGTPLHAALGALSRNKRGRADVRASFASSPAHRTHSRQHHHSLRAFMHLSRIVNRGPLRAAQPRLRRVAGPPRRIPPSPNRQIGKAGPAAGGTISPPPARGGRRDMFIAGEEIFISLRRLWLIPWTALQSLR